ncbi:MAG: hypothetical protein ABH864_06665 [archaeon]
MNKITLVVLAASLVFILMTSSFVSAGPMKAENLKKISVSKKARVNNVNAEPLGVRETSFNSQNNLTKGDLNRDGKITVTDVNLMVKVGVYGKSKTEMSKWLWTTFGWCADMDDNGRVDLSDLAALLSKI